VDVLSRSRLLQLLVFASLIFFFTLQEVSLESGTALDLGLRVPGSLQMAERQPSQFESNGGSSPPGAGHLARLLVIDDDASICAVIEKLGEKAGFAATRAVSVEEATESLRAERFDCITLDLTIGKNTGIELLEILSETARTTPIIIISGSMRSMRDFAVSIADKMNLAVQQPFAKPIDFARLKEALIGVRKKMDAAQQFTPAA
jgi:CheY-like chemotaxis protein